MESITKMIEKKIGLQHTGISNIESWFEKSLAKRSELSDKIRKQYPEKVPIILIPCSYRDPELEKYKFLADPDNYGSTFIIEVRKQVVADDRRKIANSSLTFFVNENRMFSTCQTIGWHVQLFSANDGFLYI